MIGGLGVRNPDVRPPLTRSRSHTVPSNTSPIEPSTAPPVSGRPNYPRSHSYISPVEGKPRNAQTLPTEKTSRLHIPGTGHRQGLDQPHSLRHPLRHRHTQSHAESYTRGPRPAEKTENLPHLLAGLNAERAKQQQLERHGTGNSTELKRVATGRSHRSGKLSLDANHLHDSSGRVDLRRRATSDPKSPLVTRARLQKTPIEIALDRKDARKVANRAALTAKDVESVKKEQEEAEEELRTRLADVGKTNIEITRRLDYTYYALLEKLGNLVGTIQSFQSLSTQSQHLIENFATETGKLDADIKRRVGVFQTGFETREERVADLQERGRRANVKAKDLGQRLENATIIVQNWEKRESEKARTWGRIWGMLFWTFITLFVLIVATFLAKEWWFRGDPVMAALRLPPGGSRNASLVLGKEELRKVDVPPEVREVLQGIERRRESKPIWPPLPEVEVEEVGEGKEDERLRKLDEL